MLREHIGTDPEDGGEVGDVFFGRFGLAVEDGCGCDFVAADVFGDGFEGELLLFLLCEEGRRRRGERGVLVYLE